MTLPDFAGWTAGRKWLSDCISSCSLSPLMGCWALLLPNCCIKASEDVDVAEGGGESKHQNIKMDLQKKSTLIEGSPAGDSLMLMSAKA